MATSSDSWVDVAAINLWLQQPVETHTTSRTESHTAATTGGNSGSIPTEWRRPYESVSVFGQEDPACMPSWEALAHRRSIRRTSRQQVEVSVPLHGPSDHAVWLEVCSQLRRFVYLADSTAQFTSSLPIDPPQGFGAARFHAYFSSVMGFAVPKYTYQHRGVLIVVSFVSDSKIPENACRQPDLFPFELEEAIRQHPEFSPVDEDVG